MNLTLTYKVNLSDNLKARRKWKFVDNEVGEIKFPSVDNPQYFPKPKGTIKSIIPNKKGHSLLSFFSKVFKMLKIVCSYSEWTEVGLLGIFIDGHL